MKPPKMFQIDAFTEEVFRGNPAAVVPLEDWLPDTQMQSIAAENNLAETAFFVPQGGGYHLRWFTPAQEVPLCGHATLASAFVVLTELAPERDTVEFHTLSGVLKVSRNGDRLTMDFPRHDLLPLEAPPPLLRGLGLPPREVLMTSPNPNYYAVYETEAEVRALAPDFVLLGSLHPFGVVATAAADPHRSAKADFVCRYFAPGLGIPEDPVTGSIHCALTPYWAGRLGKTILHSCQVSPRGGDLLCEDTQDRVLIAGHAVKYSEGHIFL